MPGTHETKPRSEHFRVQAQDHFELAATCFAAGRETESHPIILICPATGVKRRYYARYAEFLAQQGFTVITFDYRGVGDSRPATLNKFRAFMHEWGEKDIDAMIGWIEAHYPGRQIFGVVHSVGGQVLGLAKRARHLDAVVMIGCQSGYWRLWPFPLNYGILILWYVLIPILTTLLSYFPSRLFGMGENLPAGVAREWAAWGRQPTYVLSKEHPKRYFAEIRAPILAISFSDDGFAPKRAAEEILRFYPNAPNEHRFIRPRDLGVKSIGHFGFFRDAFRESLWTQTVEWLKQQPAAQTVKQRLS
ncbi:MAG: alpha/beta fold hydrolase [Calditrichaeota bacterium]|nr:MAG: alpha/beta fold hydrolase [Calditrichota bacterium]